MAQVTLKKIVKRYDDTEAVRGIDLDITDREFVVLVGPSGCGKSTTLRMIAGLEDITDGTIEIGGHVVNDVPPKDRDIAMVFQNYALYPHMTVAQNMSFALRLRKFPKDEIQRRVEEAARILGMQDLLDRRPKQLSGGQRQRVAMGRAIVRNPQVFLFDEPLSNLDAALRVQMRIEIARMHSDFDATMIYVTHDQVEAMTMANKIVVLQGGVIEQVGSPLELYHHPRNRFVAGFIGSPTMNFIDTQVQNVQAESMTVSLPGGGSVTAPVKDRGLKTGDKMTLGVRPEHLLESGGDGQIQGKVLVVERLGGATYIYAQIEGNQTLTAEIDGNSPVKVNDAVTLGLSGATCHLFTTDGLALEQAARHPLAAIDRGHSVAH